MIELKIKDDFIAETTKIVLRKDGKEVSKLMEFDSGSEAEIFLERNKMETKQLILKYRKAMFSKFIAEVGEKKDKLKKWIAEIDKFIFDNFHTKGIKTI